MYNFSNFQSPAYHFTTGLTGSNHFEYYNNFTKVVFFGKTYHFGKVQAKVISQLYMVSGSASPWICGKILLYNAGSKTTKMRDLFKNHRCWHDLIESDMRGSYRLQI